MAAQNRLDEGSHMFKLLNSAPRTRELTGNVDLVTHYGLREHYEQFCKKSLPSSIVETRYLRSVVGEIDIRKGEGMELGQLFQGITTAPDYKEVQIHPFNIDILRQAFTLRETGPISLPEADRGIPTVSGARHDNEEKKHRHKHKKHKHRHKDKNKDKEKDKGKEDHGGKGENGDDQSKKHRKKKRRHDDGKDDGDDHKHRKRKHKHSQVSEIPRTPM